MEIELKSRDWAKSESSMSYFTCAICSKPKLRSLRKNTIIELFDLAQSRDEIVVDVNNNRFAVVKVFSCSCYCCYLCLFPCWFGCTYRRGRWSWNIPLELMIVVVKQLVNYNTSGTLKLSCLVVVLADAVLITVVETMLVAAVLKVIVIVIANTVVLLFLLTWSHPRWGENNWIMTFDPNSKSRSKGYHVKIVHIVQYRKWPSNMKTWKPKFPTYVRDNFQAFIELCRFPIWVLLSISQKNSVRIAQRILLVKLMKTILFE